MNVEEMFQLAALAKRECQPEKKSKEKSPCGCAAPCQHIIQTTEGLVCRKTGIFLGQILEVSADPAEKGTVVNKAPLVKKTNKNRRFKRRRKNVYRGIGRDTKAIHQRKKGK